MTEASKECLPAKGHRMSKLPVVQYCGLSGHLDSGSIRPGIMSQWFHASCGEQWEEAQKYWMQLSDDERSEVRLWNPPSPCSVDSNLLEYKHAEKELEVGLDENGSYVDPTKAPAMTIGHLDMAWAYGAGHRGKVAYVGDIKRSRFTVKDNTDSLQLHAYGFAYASLRGCHSYRIGIWQAMDGVWIWGSSGVDLESSAAADIWDRVRCAALNTEKVASKGSHCQQCWGRMKCPEYVLPAAVQGTALAPLASGEMMTSEKALELLLLCEQMQDLAGHGIEHLRSYVLAGGKIVDPRTGRSYKPVEVQGKESIRKEDVLKRFGDAAKPLLKKGKPYMRWDWHK